MRRPCAASASALWQASARQWQQSVRSASLKTTTLSPHASARAPRAGPQNERGSHGFHARSHISRRSAAHHPRQRRLSALSARGGFLRLGAAARREPRLPDAVGAELGDRRPDQGRVPPPAQALRPRDSPRYGLCLLRVSRRRRCAAWRLHTLQRAPRRHAMLRAGLLGGRTIRAPGLHEFGGAGSGSLHLQDARPASHRSGLPADQRAAEKPARESRFPAGRARQGLSADRRRMARPRAIRFARGRSTASVSARIDAGRRVSRVILFAVAVLAAASALAAPVAKPAGAGIDFARADAMIELKPALAPYHAPSGPEADGSLWYMMNAVNQSVRPVTRILIAGEPPDAALRLLPLRARPVIRQIASSDAEVTVESARSYGRHGWRVTIPPATSVALAVRMQNADAAPSVVAWTEPAIISHIRQLAVFMAAVEGLIAAAVMVTAGLAFMTGHLAPRWAALTLTAIFFTRLADTGVLDAGWSTAVGGPYGMSAMIAGLALAAGLKLTDVVVPVD